MVCFLVKVSSVGAAVSGNGAEASCKLPLTLGKGGPPSSVVNVVCSVHAGKDGLQGTFHPTGVQAS